MKLKLLLGIICVVGLLSIALSTQVSPYVEGEDGHMRGGLPTDSIKGQFPGGGVGTIGPQGSKGDPGDPGYTPVKGVDYFDGAQGLRGDPGPSVPFLYSVRELQVVKNPGAATVTAVGLTAPTIVAGKNADDATAPWVACTTTTVSGTIGSILSAYTQVRGSWYPEYIAQVKTHTDITSSRIWVGLFSATPTASSAPNISAAAFRYATDVDLTPVWRCVTIAGTGSSAQVTTTTTAIATSTAYTLRLRLTPTSCLFYVNDVLVATHSSVVPTGSTLLGYGNAITGLTTSTRYLLTSRMALRF